MVKRVRRVWILSESMLGVKSMGKEQGGREAAGREAGGREVGGREAGGMEAGGTEAGGREAGGRERSGRKLGFSQYILIYSRLVESKNCLGSQCSFFVNYNFCLSRYINTKINLFMLFLHIF